jgi:hypothetical protein
MTQEVYFNREELNSFKKSSEQFSYENGVDFLLPNSLETSGGGVNFLQKVRLTRRFQRALDSIRSDSDQRDSGVSTVSQSSNEELEDFLFNQKYDETKRAALQHFFVEWRSLVDIR